MCGRSARLIALVVVVLGCVMRWSVLAAASLACALSTATPPPSADRRSRGLLDRTARSVVALSAAHPRLQHAIRRVLFSKRAIVPCPQWTVSYNASGPAAPAVMGSWTLAHAWEGASFFEGWTWFTEKDPTDGDVDYIGRDEAMAGASPVLRLS